VLERTPWLGSGDRNRTVDAFPVPLFSGSDNARSCLMISAFSNLLAFLGPSANTFAITAYATSAAATPISGMLTIYVGSFWR